MVCVECGHSFVFNLRPPISNFRNESLETKKWTQLEDFVQSRSNNLLPRPYLVLQQAGHESFEEIEHSDESKDNKNLETENDESSGYKLWCPYCKYDLSSEAISSFNRELSNDSFTSNQYVTARSRSSSTSTHIDISSLSSDNTPEKKPTRRYSTQSNYNNNSSLVISPRFSSTKRKTIRDKQTSDKVKKANINVNLGNVNSQFRPDRRKSSSPSIDSKSKTNTSTNSTNNSLYKHKELEQFFVEVYLNKNKETGSIKQLTVIRYNNVVK